MDVEDVAFPSPSCQGDHALWGRPAEAGFFLKEQKNSFQWDIPAK